MVSNSFVQRAARFALMLLAFSTTACGGAEGTAPTRGTVASVTLAPGNATLGVGSSTPFDAVVVSTVGDTMPANGISWSSSDVSVARVSSAGVVTAVAVGTATIAATVQGRSAVATVSVVPTAVASVQVSPLDLQLVEGGQGTVTARLLDAQGRVLANRAVQWQSSNAAVASVSSAGLVTGVGAGNATIIATSEGRTASMGVAVSPVAVASVSLSPTIASLAVGATRQFQAEVRDASGALLPGRAVSWSTTTPTVVSVSSTGVVVGVSPGNGQITATSGGRSASATVTVEAPPPPVVVGRVTVSPANATLKSSGSADRTV
jgi:trimeric autotransporter adhesin